MNLAHSEFARKSQTAMRASPRVHEPRRSSDTVGDVIAFEFLAGDESDDAVTMALKSLAFRRGAFTNSVRVIGMVQRELHADERCHPQQMR